MTSLVPSPFNDHGLKLVQIVATGKVVAMAEWMADEQIADGRAKAAMVRVNHVNAPAWAQVVNPDLVVVDTFDLVNLW